MKMLSDGLILCAREAAQDLEADPSLERVDDVLYCVTAVARSREARSDSLAGIAREVCGEDLLSRVLHERLPEWRSEIGEPYLDAAEDKLANLPVGEFLLLASEEADPGEAHLNRELLLGAFHHRDLLQAAAAIDVELGGRWVDWPLERADAVLRGRLLRALCCNDLRRTIARDMQPALARHLWWWSKLSDLPEDALGQWILGKLELDASSKVDLDGLLRLDTQLSHFLQDYRDVRQSLSKTRISEPVHQVLVFPASRPHIVRLKMAAQDPEPRVGEKDMSYSETYSDGDRKARIRIRVRGDRVEVCQQSGEPLRVRSSGQPLGASWSTVPAKRGQPLHEVVEAELDWAER